MAKIMEDYVSFETAKLLVKKNFGYNAEYESYYTLHGKIVYFKDNLNAINIAPRITLQMAMKWLREVHNIDIIVFHEKLPYDYYYDCYWARIERYLSTEYQQEPIYKSYEASTEEAIKYCLENLI